nr:RecName: Full=Unknown protein from spot 108 of 2D-PAGE of thylakoid [Pisum sativum]
VVKQGLLAGRIPGL